MKKRMLYDNKFSCFHDEVIPTFSPNGNVRQFILTQNYPCGLVRFLFEIKCLLHITNTILLLEVYMTKVSPFHTERKFRFEIFI